jgi:tryptophan-rich hypothetical protein
MMTNIAKKALSINSNWTSKSSTRKWKHYRLAGKKIVDGQDHYEMMAVCDRKDRFWLTVEELRDTSRWQTGWL